MTAISIHALLAESDTLIWDVIAVITISIHALLAESDKKSTSQINKLAKYFYPRSPCGERPNTNLRRHRGNDDFYPRSPCGERHNKPTQHAG